MRRRAVLAWMLLGAAPAAAVEIRSYEVRLELAADGAGSCRSVIRLADATPGTLDLPLGFARPSDLRLTAGPAGTSLEAVASPGQPLLRVILPPGVPAELEIGFALAVRDLLPPAAGSASAGVSPGDRRLFRHTLLSSQPTAIGSYRLSVIFPPGMRAHAIREAQPRLRQGEASPRAQLDAIEGQAGARLAVSNLTQGETARLDVELDRRSRSPVWALVGLLLSSLYLVGFRDLVTRRSDPS